MTNTEKQKIHLLVTIILGILVLVFVIKCAYDEKSVPAPPPAAPPPPSAPTPVSEPATNFVVSWENPEFTVENEVLPPEEITGYDVYYKHDDEAETYAAWSPYNVDDDIREVVYATSGYGAHCFSLVTVTRSVGKSVRSEWVCYDLDETVTPPVEPEIPGYRPQPVKEIIIKVTVER